MIEFIIGFFCGMIFLVTICALYAGSKADKAYEEIYIKEIEKREIATSPNSQEQ